MIPIIQKNIQARHKRIKNTTLNSNRIQFFNKVRIDKSNRTHIIIKYSDLNSGIHPLFQHLLDPLPGLGILYRVIFHKYKMFCFCQIFKLCLQPFCRLIVINCICILIHRIKCISINIRRYISGLWNALLQFFQDFVILRQQWQKLFVNLLVTFPHFTGTAIQSNQQIQSQAHDRKYHDQKDPRHLNCRGHRRCIHI